MNVQEFLPPLLLAGLFAINVADATRPAVVVLAVVLSASVTFFLVGSSIRHHRTDRRWGSTVRDQLARRAAQLEHRVWMYRNLAWWYFVPLTTAFALFIYGIGDVPPGEGLLIWGVIALILAPVYFIARRIGRGRYEDEAKRFRRLVAEFG